MALKPARLQWSDDGSLLSLDYGDIYFQRGKGLEESQYVFLERNDLPSRFKALAAGSFHIAELGFGSGLNFLLTAKLFAREAGAATRLVYAAVEKHPVRREDLEKIYAFFDLPEAPALLAQYPPLVEGFHQLEFLGGRIRLMLLLGDVADVLPQLDGKFDAWYLDGFSPAKNAAMWDDRLFPLIAARTKAGGTLATFSAAGHVRRGLEKAGFAAEKTKGYGVKRDMTVARLPGASAAAAAKKKIAVLGAGIAGCSAAYALRKRGHEVALIDRSGIAQETSGNPLGILYPKLMLGPQPLGQFYSHAFCFTRRLIEQLQLPSWRPCGVVHLDLGAADAERSRELLARSEFPAEFAAMSNGEYAGIIQAIAGMLSPVEFCLALAKDIPVLRATVSALTTTAGGWEIRDAGKNVIAAADAIVVAQAFDSKNFPETQWLPLQSLRGQMTSLTPTDQSRTLDKVICHDGYITPVAAGLHHIGATFQRETPGSPEVRSADDVENLKKLGHALPQFGLTQAHIAGSRAGYRVTTPDKLPLIGPLPDFKAFCENFAPLRTGKAVTTGPARIDGLYVATGFGAHGLSGAPLAGEMIAAMISEEPLPVPQRLLGHLLPERFIIRGLKRGQL